MNVVFVRHRPDQQQTYCFKVPDSLLPYMQQPFGFKVKCDTARGAQIGTVVSDLLVYGEKGPDAQGAGANAPCKKILSVLTNVPLNEIKISPEFTQTKPSRRKLAKRKREYRQRGRFYTHIAINTSGYLTDGYTAYLVSKDLGLPQLRCIVEA